MKSKLINALPQVDGDCDLDEIEYAIEYLQAVLDSQRAKQELKLASVKYTAKEVVDQFIKNY